MGRCAIGAWLRGRWWAWAAMAALWLALWGGVAQAADAGQGAANPPDQFGRLDLQLEIALRKAGFTGRIESSLPARLGRPIDKPLADLGRLLFFDPIGGLHGDNTCAGCHAPGAGFGDTQSTANGVHSNRLVGPAPEGPPNQRRIPQRLVHPHTTQPKAGQPLHQCLKLHCRQHGSRHRQQNAQRSKIL